MNYETVPRDLKRRLGFVMANPYLQEVIKSFQFSNGGSKHERRTFGVFYEDCYAREISRFVCNICWIELNWG